MRWTIYTRERRQSSTASAYAASGAPINTKSGNKAILYKIETKGVPERRGMNFEETLCPLYYASLKAR